MTQWGATPDDWAHFAGTLKLREDLLPAVSNPLAKISSNSSLKNLGQIPSLYNDNNEVVGIANWTKRQSSLADIKKWVNNPDYNILLQTRNNPVLDCDIVDPELSEKVFDFIDARIPNLPVRGRKNSSKFLLLFHMKGSFRKKALHINPENKIEFLATGQQFVALGTHPSGARYEWAEGLPESIPEITEDQFNALWEALKIEFEAKESKASTIDRKPPGGIIDDPALAFLETQGSVLGYSAEGSAYVSCPFKSGHSVEKDMTETVYFPAGLRGYEQGHWHCMHTSCQSRTDEDYMDAVGYRLGMFEDLGLLPASEVLAKKFEVIALEDFMKRPPTEWIIKGILPKHGLAMTFGGSGDGKTFVAIDMCMAVARGVEWNGRKVKQGRVVYVCAESTGDFINRIKAYCTHHNIDLASITNSFGVIADVPNFRSQADAKLLAERILSWGPTDLIIVDTLAQTITGADENSSKDMSMALDCSQLIMRMTNAAVELIHHAGKDEDRGARGWSGLKAPLEAQFQVYREENRRVFWVAKEKGGPDNFGWSFNLIPVPLGVDEDGDLIESLYVEWHAMETTKKNKPKIRGKNEQAVLQAFDELGGSSCEVEDLITKAIEYIPHDGEKRDQRRRNALRAITSLAADGEFTVAENKVEIRL